MPMVKSREQRLRACEKVLVEHGKQWVAVGKALMEIRDNRLYREAGYDSWAKYLKDHEADFGIGSESRANRYIQAARVSTALPPTRAARRGVGWGINHAVELDRLPTIGTAKKIANQVMEDGKVPPVREVKKAVDKALGIKPKPKRKPKVDEPPMFEEVVDRWTDELIVIASTLEEIPRADLKLFRQSQPRVTRDLVRAVKRVKKSLERLWAALPD